MRQLRYLKLPKPVIFAAYGLLIMLWLYDLFLYKVIPIHNGDTVTMVFACIAFIVILLDRGARSSLFDISEEKEKTVWDQQHEDEASTWNLDGNEYSAHENKTIKDDEIA